MIAATRLLGFAFACADFLFEIDLDGVVRFVAGATSGYFDHSKIVGKPIADLFMPNEKQRLETMWRGLVSGDRRGPACMTLASGTMATLCMYRLPPNDLISCALVKTMNDHPQAVSGTDLETGLADREAFLASAAQAAGDGGTVALVDAPDLGDVRHLLPPEAQAAVMARIGAKVRALGSPIAARLSETTFGIVAHHCDAAQDLAEGLQAAARESGLDKLVIKDYLISLKGTLKPQQIVCALRYVIGRFADGKISGGSVGDLTIVFNQFMDETLDRMNTFNATVANSQFDLVFEPIVELASGATRRYEALTRFRSGESPAETIRFAEDLQIIEPLDLAVSVKALDILEKADDGTAIAINISGRSFWNPTAFAILAGFLGQKRSLAARVSIEITESEKVGDLGEANKNVQHLREMGYRVGIDDFGAGAASLQYLHGFAVDFVKIDGSVIQRLGKSQREDALLRCILACCTELEIETVAEWIDGIGKLEQCKEIGFRSGQGRHFGSPLKQLPRTAQLSSIRGRRLGERETWA